MKIAVLCDGGGLARLGLERAGHICVGFELNPVAHYLSTFVGSGRCILADIRDVDLTPYEAAWSSPPCQWRSTARDLNTTPMSPYTDGTLHHWCLEKLAHQEHIKTWWLENVQAHNPSLNRWGLLWNAAQFLPNPIQNRNRIIGGHYPLPRVYSAYKRRFAGISPCVTATEYQGHANDTRRASRFFGRRLTLEECAALQGFEIPRQWYKIPAGWTGPAWKRELYRAVGNGVPVYMARAFGWAALWEDGPHPRRGEWPVGTQEGVVSSLFSTSLTTLRGLW